MATQLDYNYLYQSKVFEVIFHYFAMLWEAAEGVVVVVNVNCYCFSAAAANYKMMLSTVTADLWRNKKWEKDYLICGKMYLKQ